MKLYKQYRSARKTWNEAGRPTRTDEEVSHIFNDICKPCPHFKPLPADHGWCDACKCNLNLGSTLNKIRWATEKCPTGRWSAEVQFEKGFAVTPLMPPPVEPRGAQIFVTGTTPEEQWESHLEQREKRREERSARRWAKSNNSK